MFLATLNLPASDGPEFLFWVEKIFRDFAGRDLDEAAKAVVWIRGYFGRRSRTGVRSGATPKPTASPGCSCPSSMASRSPTRTSSRSA
jgi:hypothetical protein